MTFSCFGLLVFTGVLGPHWLYPHHCLARLVVWNISCRLCLCFPPCVPQSTAGRSQRSIPRPLAAAGGGVAQQAESSARAGLQTTVTVCLSVYLAWCRWPPHTRHQTPAPSNTTHNHPGEHSQQLRAWPRSGTFTGQFSEIKL